MEKIMASDSLQYTEILAALRHAYTLQYIHWQQYELFTWQWWFLLGLLIIPWLVWWKLVDRARTGIILVYGFYIIFVVTLMDATGSVLQNWLYPITLLPVFPFTIGLDWGILVVMQMLIFQYFTCWKEFLIAEFSVAAFMAFIGEPIAEWMGIYCALHWYHHWSFPIYLMMAVIGKWLIESIVYQR